jgi:hypothetical protein
MEIFSRILFKVPCAQNVRCLWKTGSNCVNGCIIGLDRTFNTSSCYITVVCFQNKNVIKKNTSEPPIMLGPIVMHWDGNFETYHRFISHFGLSFLFALYFAS